MTGESGRLSNVAYLGFGECGVNMLESWLKMLPDDALCIALDRDETYLHKKKGFKHKLPLSNVKCMGSTVEYSESVQAEVERSMGKQMAELEAMLQERNSVVVLAGLGGVIGSWASQFICNHLIAMGKQVVTVLVMPFSIERERMKVAKHALPGFDGAAHRVLCFNDYLIKHSPEHMSMTDAFEIMNEKAFELLSSPD